MDTNVGLDYIVDNPDYCNELASGLDSTCVAAKKQVVELLSALAVYSDEGRQRVFDTLHISQNRRKERYRLRILIDELQKASTEDYKSAVLALINCLIISTPVLKDRIRLRNEFIGLKLLPILNDLRRQENQLPDLRVQLEVFDDQRETDEELANHVPSVIDLSSHVDVFYAILSQVTDTPQEIPFLSILQHLLRLDPKDAASDLAWDTAEKLVHRATLIETQEDVTKLLRSSSLQMNFCCHNRCNDQMLSPRKSSLQLSSTIPHSISTAVTSKAQSSESASSKGLSLPPPPPPPLLLFDNPTINDVTDAPPPIPPPFNLPTINRAPTPEVTGAINAKLLPQQEIPAPKTKMRTINWNKIPEHKVIGKKNVWSLVATEHKDSPMADLDWSEMEGLFCQQQVSSIVASSSSALSSGCAGDTDRRRREPMEIVLLDGKRSLNVNIFLKQFRSSNENIIQLIKEGAHDDIGAEKLRGLLKILPEIDELEMLKGFEGDKSKLGNAEKFFLQLIEVPNYKLRIECMLLREEFASNMGYLEPIITSMILAGEDLMTNKPLQQVLYMVLVAGNFLNSGGYAGNAAGVKLSSLQKLTEIRANKPGMNLIHFVALQAEKKQKELLNFAKNINTLETASKTTIEQLTNEFNTLDAKIRKIKEQIEGSSPTEKDIQDQMMQFLQVAQQEMLQLKRDMEELENVRINLAEFFCEDINTFKIEECYKTFYQFYLKFNQAVAENERRRIQEEQMSARRKQREEQLLAKKRLLNNQINICVTESENNLIDYGIIDIQSHSSRSNRNEGRLKKSQNGGAFITSDDDISINDSPSIRRRLGSCSGPNDHQTNRDEIYSPDITPNGTLRRRRSRVPCEDDGGNLMEFLRTKSGHETTRERKSWGSLDRSWARRARGQSRRSDILNADFSADRERPSSPSPLAETKSFLEVEEDTKTTGRGWRQKIEAWLSENEKEDILDERLQKKRNEVKKPIATEDNPHDWTPSSEKADVMQKTDTSEISSESNGLQCQRTTHEGAFMTLEETDPRYCRPRVKAINESTITQSPLHAIREEERKNKNKSIENELHEDDNLLTIYLRPPSSTLHTSSLWGLPKYTRNEHEFNKGVSNKIDIDSDNIETPPVTRKIFNSTREVKPVEKEPCKRERCNSSQNRERLGIVKHASFNNDSTGNFDRYSAARRTRRYKKNHDSVERELPKPDCLDTIKDHGDECVPINTSSFETDGQLIEQRKMTSTPQNIQETRLAVGENNSVGSKEADAGKEIRKRTAIQSRCNSRLPISQPTPVIAVTNTVLSPVMQEPKLTEAIHVRSEKAIACRERHRSMIDPSHVKRAMKLGGESSNHTMRTEIGINSTISNGKSARLIDSAFPKTEQINRSDVKSSKNEYDSKHQLPPAREKDLPFLSTNENHVTKHVTPALKTKLVSNINSLSLSPYSIKTKDHDSLNDEGFEETQSLVSETLSQEASSGNYDIDIHDNVSQEPTTNNKESIEKAKARNIRYDGITRFKSFENYPETKQKSIDSRSTCFPRKPQQLTCDVKVEPALKHTHLLKNRIEKSGSRTSLRSSRSSLNSATSVNTVRKSASNNSQFRNHNSGACAIARIPQQTKPTSNVSVSQRNTDKKKVVLKSAVPNVATTGRNSTGLNSADVPPKNDAKVKSEMRDFPRSSNSKITAPVISTRSSSNSKVIPGETEMRERRTFRVIRK